mgnify:CR=1 FL=1
MVSRRVYMKKVTLANDALITDIEAYINALRGRQPQSDPARAASLAGFDDPSNYG